MHELKLHSFGRNDHLQTLKEKYDSLKNSITESKELNNSEKKEKLIHLKKSYQKAKEDSKNNLY